MGAVATCNENSGCESCISSHEEVCLFASELVSAGSAAQFSPFLSSPLQSRDFMKPNEESLRMNTFFSLIIPFFLSSGQQEEWEEERKRLQHGNRERWRLQRHYGTEYNAIPDCRCSIVNPDRLECRYATRSENDPTMQQSVSEVRCHRGRCL